MQGLKNQFTLILFFSMIVISAESARRISLDKPMTGQLNKVMEAVSEIHKAMYAKDKDKFSPALKTALVELTKTKQLSAKVEDHKRQHLVKILDASITNLNLANSSVGRDQTKWLRSSFEQFANLLRTYKLDRQYKILFCSSDKSTWVQKGWGRKNPFNPSRKCGKFVL